jgi:hypothetical protein
MWVNVPESLNVSANRSVDACFESRPNSTYPTSKVPIVHLLGSSEAEISGTFIMREVVVVCRIVHGITS